MKIDRDDVGGCHVERDDDMESITWGPGDNLTIVLCSYFSRHEDRPEDDELTESDDNCFWGDWVTKKVEEALDLIVDQLQEAERKNIKHGN